MMAEERPWVSILNCGLNGRIVDSSDESSAPTVAKPVVNSKKRSIRDVHSACCYCAGVTKPSNVLHCDKTSCRAVYHEHCVEKHAEVVAAKYAGRYVSACVCECL